MTKDKFAPFTMNFSSILTVSVHNLIFCHSKKYIVSYAIASHKKFAKYITHIFDDYFKNNSQFGLLT